MSWVGTASSWQVLTSLAAAIQGKARPKLSSKILTVDYNSSALPGKPWAEIFRGRRTTHDAEQRKFCSATTLFPGATLLLGPRWNITQRDRRPTRTMGRAPRRPRAG